jgi:GT2 family glycosyltransferase
MLEAARKPAAAAAPRFSVLIVGYNSLRFLDECLATTLASGAASFEVLFLDNGSPQAEADWVENRFHDPRLRVFRSQRNLYFAGGVNLLAKEARGEILILLNPDTRVEPSWLAALDACLRKGFQAAQADLRSLAAGGKEEPPGYFIDRYGFIVHAEKTPDPNPRRIFGGRGAGLAVERAVFFECGALDENFLMYFEETDLCWRINLLGYKIAYAPGSIVHHLVGGSNKPAFFRWGHYRFIRNRIWSLLQNYEPMTLLRVLPVHLALCAGGMLANAMRGKLGKAASEGAALLSVWSRLPTVMARRKQVQALRKVTDAGLMEARLILPEGKYFQHRGCGGGKNPESKNAML